MPTFFKSGTSTYFNSDETWEISSTVATLAYNPNTYYTSIDTYKNNYHEPKHFNCKCCGAPNQIDICEYCGSAYEE